ncbi:MAG: peroxiredoxin [Fidelibacterota bacterium]
MKEASGFQSASATFTAGEIQLFGISADSPEALRNFAEKLGVSYPLLSDADRTILKRFGAWGKKKLYGREYEGIVRSTVILNGDNVVTHVFPRVRPAGHALEVLKALGV